MKWASNISRPESRHRQPTRAHALINMTYWGLVKKLTGRSNVTMSICSHQGYYKLEYYSCIWSWTSLESEPMLTRLLKRVILGSKFEMSLFVPQTTLKMPRNRLKNFSKRYSALFCLWWGFYVTFERPKYGMFREHKIWTQGSISINLVILDRSHWDLSDKIYCKP